MEHERTETKQHNELGFVVFRSLIWPNFYWIFM